ncbi:MAG: two-component system, OmpR family, phosphate regulon sensor histidine kinase PhoR [Bryobacterales bacterium]|jgi:signal transduction histidine kinase|nr:two-component system, OmpR family, phosphate regulon sensor histidine kinase PhoR [Bryobacterales bacterium]
MQITQGFGPSHRAVVMLASIMLITAFALCTLAWRMLELDHAVAGQRQRERLEQAADRGSAALLRYWAQLDADLGRFVQQGQPPASLLPHDEDALLVSFTKAGMQLWPDRPLRYRPWGSPPTPVVGPFAAAEDLEFGALDYAAAAKRFHALSKAANPTVRAEALLRAARNERKAGQAHAALATYARLAAIGATSLNGEPAELVARHARLSLLPEAAREQEAAALWRDLDAGRWPLSRTSFAFYAGELGHAIPIAVWEETVAALFEEWQRAEADRGERTLWIAGAPPVLLSWRNRSDFLVGFAARPGYFEQRYLRGAGIQYAVLASDGRLMLGNNSAEGKRARRVISFGQVPLTLEAAGGSAASDEGQSSLLRLGVVLVLVLVITGSGAVLRAIHRELAVARLQSDFVAAVSHEFRSPLTTLNHLTDLLQDDRVRSEERRKRYYKVLASETTRLHRLVEDLLDFGRMEAGARRYRLEELDAVALVDEVVADFRKEAEDLGFTVDLQADVPRALVAADSEALRRALWNLLDNATKYSPDHKAVWVTITEEQDRLAVHVRDEGMGISPAEQRRIFRKFERGAEAKAASIRGTGLGLAMVQGIMRAHGGGVQLQSEPQCGSTFTLWLPLAA